MGKIGTSLYQFYRSRINIQPYWGLQNSTHKAEHNNKAAYKIVPKIYTRQNCTHKKAHTKCRGVARRVFRGPMHRVFPCHFWPNGLDLPQFWPTQRNLPAWFDRTGWICLTFGRSRVSCLPILILSSSAVRASWAEIFPPSHLFKSM